MAIQVSVRGLVQAVAHLFNVKEDEVLSKSRDHAACEARQWVYYILFRGGLGYVEIGKRVGRHYTTIHHGVQRSQQRVKTGEGVKTYRKLVDLIRAAA